MINFATIRPIEVIETIIGRMRYGGDITDISASGDQWVTTATNVSNLSLNDYVVISGEAYKIVGLTSTTFTTDLEPTGTTWEAQAPSFYHGTPVKVEDDRYKDLNGNEMRYPFICLYEPIKSTLNTSGENPIGEEVELWLLFMDKSRTDMTTDQHHTTINAMADLMMRFLKACDDASDLVQVADDQELSIIRHAEFGLVAKIKGHEKYLMDDNLSGVEIENYTLRIIKKPNC